MSQAGSFTPSSLPPGTVVETLTGNTGGAVGPNGADNINVIGDGTSITVSGNPLTNTLTISAIGGGTLVETLTGNTGGAISPLAGNINVIGDGTTIAIAGSGHTLTASLVGTGAIQTLTGSTSGGAISPLAGNVNITAGTGISVIGTAHTLTIATTGAVSESFPTDSGTATPSAGVLNIVTGKSSVNSGSSIAFFGSGDTVTLNTSDSNLNVIIGNNAGNNTLSGTDNTALGTDSATNLTTGSQNTFIGFGAGSTVTTGSDNIIIGYNAGSSLTTSDTNNTLIGRPGFSGATDFISIAAGSTGPLMFHNYPGTNANTGNGGNLFIGQGAGNLTLTGATIFNNNGIGQNSLASLTTGHLNNCLGYGALTALTTGNRNNAFGHQTGSLLVSGSYNVLLGNLSGSTYTTSESSNIQINNLGTLGESNVLRIGAGTGSGNQQLNKAYISGIAGVNVGSVATVVTENSDQLGTAIITAGTGITITPGANTITIATTALTSAITSITGDTGGAQTGPAITFAGGTTGLSFGGATNTITTTFAGITANGGTVSLATDATTSTVNVGTGAGIKTVTLGSTNSSSSLALKSGTGNFNLTSASGTTITALAAGEVTMPRQPAFEVRLASSLTNVTGDGTFYPVVFDTVVYDQGSNVNLSGPPTEFIAPVNGIYHFVANAFYSGLGVSFTDLRLNIVLDPGSIGFPVARINPSVINTGGYFVANGSAYVAMTAGQVMSLQIYVAGSTKTVGLLGDASGSFTTFSGVLVC